MRNLIFFCSCFVFIYASVSAQVKSIKLSSPDNNTQIDINGKLEYRINHKNKPVLAWSPMGLVVNNVSFNKNPVIEKQIKESYTEKFYWPLGENDTINNRYNEVKLFCRASGIPFNIIVRAYNGSIAFRYEISSQQPRVINSENTEFNFITPQTIYQYNQESVFMPKSIDTFTNTSDLPATLTNGKFYIHVGEADNTNYTKAELKKGAAPHSLSIVFPRDKSVAFSGNYFTPWRTISVAERAIDLHQFSELNLKLASSPAASVPKWIKPGKLIRAQLNTQSGLDCIDFAADHNFQYILFDAGWYGAEFRSSSDPTQVIPEIDMPIVIAYGKEKGIGVILYVNYVGLRAKLDTILPLYKKWGVAGLKFGFVDGLTQEGLTWLSAAMQIVYDHGFILNIHDNYKPTGLSRQFPNLLTQEGIRGDENSPDAFHNTVLPFTRFLAGPADFTFCYPNSTNSYSKNIKVSMAQQLALTVINFSPLQSMLWYGKPKEYTNEQEIEFFKHVPTVWNESLYLAGDIGKNIAVARRNGNTWYVGIASGPEDWEEILDLHFLKPGKKYTATIYEDDGKGSIRKRIDPVTNDDQFCFYLQAGRGQAIIIRE